MLAAVHRRFYRTLIVRRKAGMTDESLPVSLKPLLQGKPHGAGNATICVRSRTWFARCGREGWKRHCREGFARQPRASRSINDAVTAHALKGYRVGFRRRFRRNQTQEKFEHS